MTAFKGVVSIDKTEVPVVVDITDEGVRMLSGESEIGSWTRAECNIRRLDGPAFGITAEDETLRFMPHDTSAFASAVNGHFPNHAEPLVAIPRGRHLATASNRDVEVPPPSTMTFVAFLVLCAATAGLGIWALIRMIIG